MRHKKQRLLFSWMCVASLGSLVSMGEAVSSAQGEISEDVTSGSFLGVATGTTRGAGVTGSLSVI